MEDKPVSLEKLEKQMDEHLVEKAPFQIPESGRQMLVTWAPWLALISGVFSLISVIGLWRTADRINATVQNSFNSEGQLVYVTQHVSMLYYLACIALLVEGLLMLAAFPGLQSRSKAKGWNILLYATLVGVLYNVLIGFTEQGANGNLMLAFLFGLVGLYLLAQCKSHYAEASEKPAKKTATKKK